MSESFVCDMEIDGRPGLFVKMDDKAVWAPMAGEDREQLVQRMKRSLEYRATEEASSVNYERPDLHA